MSLELLKRNIQQEKELVKRLMFLSRGQSQVTSQGQDKRNIDLSIEAIKKQIKILNDSLPKLIDNVKLTKELTPGKEVKKSVKKEDVISVSHTVGEKDNLVGILKKDKNNYLKQLHIAESSLRKLKKKNKEKVEEFVNVYKRPSGYIKVSNKLFSNVANSMVEKGGFKGLKRTLRKGNFMILTKSYVAMMFFTTFISVFLGLMLAVFFFFISLSTISPFVFLVDFSEVSILIRILQVIWLIPVVPLLTFLAFYFYPSAEKTSLQQKIDYEIPFATIQMSAIAGSDIEPSNIFRIIALSKEYPNIRNEAKKLMNQINLYGYDLITALKNIAVASPSKAWADLLNGISTAIRSGGDLSKYLNKKAESLLFDYKLKREKAIKSAETFMDIYISVVIAAPMLMMLLLIMINISGIGFNMPLSVLTIIIISIVAVINFVFLVFLHLSQKKI